MSVRRFLSIFLVSLFAVSCLGAAVCTRPSAGAWAGGAFCMPTADYLKQYPGDEDAAMPPVRTSFSFGADANLLNIASGRFSAGLGVSFVSTGRSMAFGQSSLKPYRGLGFLLEFDCDFTSLFTAGLKLRYLGCTFNGSASRFICAEAELVPSLRIFSAGPTDGFVSLPVALSYRTDAITVRTSLALTLRFDSSRMRRPE